MHPQEGRGGKQAGAGRITGMVGERESYWRFQDKLFWFISLTVD